MKNLSMVRFFILLLIIAISSCKENKELGVRRITKVEIQTLLQDSLLNVRALEVIRGKDAFFLTSSGFGGVIYFSDFDKKENIVYPVIMAPDSIKNNFRAFASNDKYGFGLTIGAPARLYKIKNDEKVIVYQENHPEVFYDSMDFWNDQEGIAIGDSIDGCLSIIITRDGGESWTKLSCADLPKAEEGEGAFAASDTNIAIVGNKTWVATTHGNIYFSADKGLTWKVTKTPILKEKPTQGIYSIDFYDEYQGFAIGGDYTEPNNTIANKIKTIDGGKTWVLAANGKTPNYRSCVQYMPGRGGKELVAIGFKGIDFSNDAGESWTHISDEGFYTLRFLNDSVAYAAGQGRVSKLIFKE